MAAASDEGGFPAPPAIIISSSVVDGCSSSSSSSSSSSTMYHYLSVLQDKINELQSLVGVVASPNSHYHSSINYSSSSSSYSMALSTMTSTIQDIIVASSSIRLSFQQHINNNNNHPSGTMITTSSTSNNNHQQLQLLQPNHHHHHQSYDYNIIRGGSVATAEEVEEETLRWLSEPFNNNNSTIFSDNNNNNPKDHGDEEDEDDKEETDIIELNAADLLASYTHFCQICGKGFKREANLRMHMRAHGDEFKSNAALKNKGMILLKNNNKKKKKYSCPEEGCRWNKNHARFQALKSMVCVKNHYKRSHCPKMYVCKRCNNKNFSLLSDLRTHEKHCGDPNKWLCSCGTTFSRKDKLIGHLALFHGHSPANAASIAATQRTT